MPSENRSSNKCSANVYNMTLKILNKVAGCVSQVLLQEYDLLSAVLGNQINIECYYEPWVLPVIYLDCPHLYISLSTVLSFNYMVILTKITDLTANRQSDPKIWGRHVQITRVKAQFYHKTLSCGFSFAKPRVSFENLRSLFKAKDML